MAPETYKELTKVYDIPVDDMVIKPEYQPRTKIDEGKIKELAESIREKGQQQPILFKVEDEQPVLVAGHRRLMAIKDELKQGTIRGILVEGNPLEVALIENVVREGLTALEEAKAYSKMIAATGCKQQDIAAITGKAPATISETLSITEKIKKELLDQIEGEHPSCPRWVLLAVAGQKKKEQEATFKKIMSKNLTRGIYKESIKIAPAKQPQYLATTTAKKIGNIAPGNYNEADKEKLINALELLVKAANAKIVALRETLPPVGESTQQGAETSSDELSA